MIDARGGHGYRPATRADYGKTHCKRCMSPSVSWVKSTRTGRWYLAFATRTDVYPHILHDCYDPTRGGKLDPATKP